MNETNKNTVSFRVLVASLAVGIVVAFAAGWFGGRRYMVHEFVVGMEKAFPDGWWEAGLSEERHLDSR